MRFETLAIHAGERPSTQEIVADAVQPLTVKPTLESVEEVLGVPV